MPSIHRRGLCRRDRDPRKKRSFRPSLLDLTSFPTFLELILRHPGKTSYCLTDPGSPARPARGRCPVPGRTRCSPLSTTALRVCLAARHRSNESPSSLSPPEWGPLRLRKIQVCCVTLQFPNVTMSDTAVPSQGTKKAPFLHHHLLAQVPSPASLPHPHPSPNPAQHRKPSAGHWRQEASPSSGQQDGDCGTLPVKSLPLSSSLLLLLLLL